MLNFFITFYINMTFFFFGVFSALEVELFTWKEWIKTFARATAWPYLCVSAVFKQKGITWKSFNRKVTTALRLQKLISLFKRKAI